MTVKYIINPTKKYVIAIVKSDGKAVKGVAKCSPNDTFDEEVGKRLAAARCKVKVMKKQAESASRYVELYRELKEGAERKLAEHEQFAWDCWLKVDNAEAELKEAIQSVK